MSYEEILNCAYEDCHNSLDFSEYGNMTRGDTFMATVWNLLSWEKVDNLWYCPRHVRIYR